MCVQTQEVHANGIGAFPRNLQGDFLSLTDPGEIPPASAKLLLSAAMGQEGDDLPLPVL